jgi:hypothetical protein
MVAAFLAATAVQGAEGPGIQCVYHWNSQLRGSPRGTCVIMRSTAVAYLASIALPCWLVALKRVRTKGRRQSLCQCLRGGFT